MKRGTGILSMILLLFLFSCSDNPPRINHVQWQVILFRNNVLNTMYQKLSVFAAASDKDGQKDLSYLHVINDDEELYWTVSSDKWDKATIRSNEYVGSNGFTMPYGQKLPTGSYRIVIEDWSGKRVEEKIYVKKENVDTEQAQFPVVDQSGGNISVAGNFTDPEIWIYDSNDQFLTRLTLTNKSIAASSVIAKNTEKLAAGFTYYIYAKQPGVYYAVLSGPYFYSPEP